MQTEAMRVLVVEDEQDVRELMALHLKRDGFEVVVCEDGDKALAKLREGRFQLIIVDWMLPGISGLDLTHNLSRQAGMAPILMVTARADPTDVIRGLENGADDYVTKPFEVGVFLARVRALIRRVQKRTSNEPQTVLFAGGIRLNSETFEVTVAGQKVDLTPSEFKLLQSLMLNQGRVLSRDKLIEMVQGEGVSVVDRAIDTHVFGLRKKLGESSEFIETIRGIGYRVKSE